jgi:hypothetical protein
MYEYRKANPEITYDEIGEKYGMSGSRAFTIIKAVERNLKTSEV